ncbi:MAG: hypothetical protein E7178_01600 [Erysipelotrichaceae bacterium]|nr:hypothetical protein [Erysipelotrichaceae bacterium]
MSNSNKKQNIYITLYSADIITFLTDSIPLSIYSKTLLNGVVSITIKLMKNNIDKMIINGILSCILNTLYSKNMNPMNKRISIITRGRNTGKDKSVGLV